MNKIAVRGWVEVTVTRAGGGAEFYIGSNIVVNAGKQLIADRLGGIAVNAVTHAALGSSTQVVAEADTILIGTEHERVAGVITITANEFKLSATFGAGIVVPVTVGEFGLFNAAAGGTMLARFVTPEINIAADDTIDMVWTIQFGD